jgi:hypothetical protein
VAELDGSWVVPFATEWSRRACAPDALL